MFCSTRVRQSVFAHVALGVDPEGHDAFALVRPAASGSAGAHALPRRVPAFFTCVGVAAHREEHALASEERGGELGLGARGDDLALADDEDAVAGLADLGEDVAGDERGVLLAEAAQELAHLDDLHRVEAGDGLVEDEQARPVDDGLRDADALPEAVGKRGDDVVAGRRPTCVASSTSVDALLGVGGGTGRGGAPRR